MPRSRFSLAVVSLLFLVAARHRAVQHPAGWPLTEPPRDIFTFSQPALVTTKHLALDLTVDFESRRLHGSARLDIENLAGTRTLVLDTYQLDVSSVTLDGGTAATWSFGATGTYGRPLNISIEPATRSVTVHYSSSADAPGLFWNTAEQSYGRQQPYLYSLNEPVGARSWIPSQDTPAVRSTYEAVIHAPHGLMAVMSAADNPVAVNDTGVYRFTMPYRIPVYLVAIAVGRLEFHPFDERTGVYAEPELIDAAAWELAYLPEMVDAAERIAGEYPFERYDLLLAPPTFVAGGMEHPMLNIVQPFSVVSGNRPAILQPSSLVAHELAHSWAGDATTLATWNDVWLNEGITSYLTIRILEELSGDEVAELQWFNSRRSYEGYAQSNPAESVLHRNVPYPGAGFDSTGYTKGALFTKMLEDTIGREPFDHFLRRYFQIFKYRWVDDQNFTALLRELVLDGRPGLEDELQLSTWLYSPGLPSNTTAATSSAIHARALARSQQFTTGRPIAELAPATWTPEEITLFLQLSSAQVVRSRMAEIDAALNLSSRTAAPFAWLVHAMYARYEPATPAIERAVLRGGPNGTILSLYTSLLNAGQRDRALALFAQARDRYADNVERQLEAMLGLNGAAAAKAA
ncbi:MAG TPA: M1 family aminopeptidase/hydrolase [Thermoanaerobaculia bacterium]|nr:M1 family aminopeptidase/hydrolase [Thermoanaerobaculia bacterium]